MVQVVTFCSNTALSYLITVELHDWKLIFFQSSCQLSAQLFLYQLVAGSSLSGCIPFLSCVFRLIRELFFLSSWINDSESLRKLRYKAELKSCAAETWWTTVLMLLTVRNVFHISSHMLHIKFWHTFNL